MQEIPTHSVADWQRRLRAREMGATDASCVKVPGRQIALFICSAVPNQIAINFFFFFSHV
jgi:hypothetical protein